MGETSGMGEAAAEPAAEPAGEAVGEAVGEAAGEAVGEAVAWGDPDDEAGTEEEPDDGSSGDESGDEDEGGDDDENDEYAEADEDIEADVRVARARLLAARPGDVARADRLAGPFAELMRAEDAVERAVAAGEARAALDGLCGVLECGHVMMGPTALAGRVERLWVRVMCRRYPAAAAARVDGATEALTRAVPPGAYLRDSFGYRVRRGGAWGVALCMAALDGREATVMRLARVGAMVHMAEYPGEPHPSPLAVLGASTEEEVPARLLSDLLLAATRPGPRHTLWVGDYFQVAIDAALLSGQPERAQALRDACVRAAGGLAGDVDVTVDPEVSFRDMEDDRRATMFRLTDLGGVILADEAAAWVARLRPGLAEQALVCGTRPVWPEAREPLVLNAHGEAQYCPARDERWLRLAARHARPVLAALCVARLRRGPTRAAPLGRRGAWVAYPGAEDLPVLMREMLRGGFAWDPSVFDDVLALVWRHAGRLYVEQDLCWARIGDRALVFSLARAGAPMPHFLGEYLARLGFLNNDQELRVHLSGVQNLLRELIHLAEVCVGHQRFEEAALAMGFVADLLPRTCGMMGRGPRRKQLRRAARHLLLAVAPYTGMAVLAYEVAEAAGRRAGRVVVPCGDLPNDTLLALWDALTDQRRAIVPEWLYAACLRASSQRSRRAALRWRRAARPTAADRRAAAARAARKRRRPPPGPGAGHRPDGKRGREDDDGGDEGDSEARLG